jgi:hypothetical protein
MMVDNAKKWRLQKLAQGLCPRCGINPPIKDRISCIECLKKSAQELRCIRAKKKKEGKCNKCSKKAIPDRRLCQAHQDESLAYNRKLIEDRRLDGVCEKCGRNKAIENTSRNKGCFCEECYLKVVAASHLGSAKMWGQLVELATSDLTCPYTGYKLKIGVNASLDHIIPKAQGGGNEKTNLQFVYCHEAFDVNRMKGEMTENEFKCAIKIIYENMLKDVDTSQI